MLLFVWLTTETGALSVFGMGLILIILGIPLYTVIRLQTDKKFTEKFYDRIAPVWDRLFRIWYSEGDARRIVKHLKLNRGSNVLDFGCGSGTTTIALAEKAKNVVAVDLSEGQMRHAIRKIKRMELPNVMFVKGDRRFPKNSFDAVTAVGVLEFVDRPHAYVARMLDSLRPGGRFYFLSFGRSLGIPAPEFVRKENIGKLFSGKKVRYKTDRTKRRFTEYVHIYGVKK
jgi:ubiquinone/menaquinone biosynthesis C-methylase UbiE